MGGVTAPAVIFEGVWKKYQRGRRYDSVRELVPALAGALLRPGSRGGELGRQEFWALRDVSFAVQPGEALGVIGPNGAGKSTILKLLSRIIAPTRGRVDVRGRMGALIEVAAGFHPDLTGRENVFLQGAIMGMKRAEIVRKFAEIVEFAGVSDFVDTQVKHYSSGMQARLGFAVAAHLDPEVLLIDEVLAVGDLAFQHKVFERLKAMVRREIPVVIVSHQLDRVVELCRRAVLLTAGRVVRAGTAVECVAAYVDGEHLAEAGHGPAPVQLHAISEAAPALVHSGEPLTVRLQGAVVEPAGGSQAAVGVWVRSLPSEEFVFATHSAAFDLVLPVEGPFEVAVELEMNLGPGAYRVQAVVWSVPARTPWAFGPSTIVRVERALPAYGRAYLNPRMHLLAP
ncbi:MAG: ABC transporter ATP-binding protein [Gemmatimonadetes bacterium]|nr:MAG: ABC transporter ATP-binding protein [Gemmatimonadota bacterium]